LARPMRAANGRASPYTDPSADAGTNNLAPRSRGGSKSRRATAATLRLSGSGSKLGDEGIGPPNAGALRPLAKALIDLALSMLAEQNREEEKAA
jgi:hypothetical protein